MIATDEKMFILQRIEVCSGIGIGRVWNKTFALAKKED